MNFEPIKPNLFKQVFRIQASNYEPEENKLVIAIYDTSGSFRRFSPWFITDLNFESPSFKVVLAALLLAGIGLFTVSSIFPQPQSTIAKETACTHWVAPPPTGNDANPGTEVQPWATLEHASNNVPDNECLVWFEDGTYTGNHRINRRFTTTTTFKAINPYQAVFENNITVVNISGATNITLEGFVFQHDGPGATLLVVIIDGSKDGWAEMVTLRNNIFHDSYDNDLLKILDGVRFATIENNVFYNQGPNEDHIDVNSVTDITIQDNIFFNDYEGSGRVDPGDTKSFITVKDSNEDSDGLLGSERVAIRRNIFLNWQGDSEPFLQIGNDGKPYHEAEDVWIENNLMLGNSTDDVNAVLAVSGAKNVSFTNNTVLGDFPARAYAFRIDQKGLNPKNENIFFYNNIWSDATGTMGAGPSNSTNEFSDGDPVRVDNLIIDNNLYWNGGAAIPPGEVASPMIDDDNRVVANPELPTDLSNVILPRWNGITFLSGSISIREEFERLVMLYAQIPADSPAIDQANAALTPADDILGQTRPTTTDMGAYEKPPKLSQSITVVLPDASSEYTIGSTVPLSATASSGLPVSYRSETVDVCTISNQAATLIAVGECRITVSQSGDDTYAPAEDVTISFPVSVVEYPVFLPMIISKP